jgi:hypothetical protein
MDDQQHDDVEVIHHMTFCFGVLCRDSWILTKCIWLLNLIKTEYLETWIFAKNTN